MSGAFSLTIITLNKVIGIMMPNLANILISNRGIVYATLVGIWTISICSAAPSVFFREYDVSYYIVISYISKIKNQERSPFLFFSGIPFQRLYSLCLP